MRTLAISPELRPQSMLSMSQELGRADGGGAVAGAADRRHRSRAAQEDAVCGGGPGGGGGGEVGVTWYAVDHLSGRGGELVKQPIAGAAAIPGAAAAQPQPTKAEPTVFPPTTIDDPRAPAPSVAPNTPLATKVITVEKPVVLKSPTGDPKASAPLAPPSPALALAEAKRMFSRPRRARRRWASATPRPRSCTTACAAPASSAGRRADGAGGGFVSARAVSRGGAVLGHRAVESGGGVAARMVLGNSYFKLGKYDEAISRASAGARGRRRTSRSARRPAPRPRSAKAR